MLHACDQRLDVTGNLKKFCKLKALGITYKMSDIFLTIEV